MDQLMHGFGNQLIAARRMEISEKRQLVSDISKTLLSDALKKAKR